MTPQEIIDTSRAARFDNEGGMQQSQEQLVRAHNVCGWW
jgi:hypothetical protein